MLEKNSAGKILARINNEEFEINKQSFKQGRPRVYRQLEFDSEEQAKNILRRKLMTLIK